MNICRHVNIVLLPKNYDFSFLVKGQIFFSNDLHVKLKLN